MGAVALLQVGVLFLHRPGSTDAIERNELEIHGSTAEPKLFPLDGCWSEDALDNTGEVVVATGLTEQSSILPDLDEGKIYRTPPIVTG